jgi:hypothetical protein
MKEICENCGEYVECDLSHATDDELLKELKDRGVID